MVLSKRRPRGLHPGRRTHGPGSHQQGNGHHALGSAPEILTLGGLPDDLASRHRLPSGTVPAAITLACVAAFAFGHKQGQEKAARDARQWLELDG